MEGEDAARSATPVRKETVFKVLVIGDTTVGKTSFIHRYTRHEDFTGNYTPTIGVDFSLKVIERSENETIRVQLWDIAGQERFTNMTRVYYNGAAGCVVIFDLSVQKTMDNVALWKQDLDSKAAVLNGMKIPCILLANKCDVVSRCASVEEVDQLSHSLGFLRWFEISVKNGTGITEAMSCLLDAMIENENKAPAPPPPQQPPPKAVTSPVRVGDDESDGGNNAKCQCA